MTDTITQYEAIGVGCPMGLRVIREEIAKSDDELYQLYIPLKGASVRYMGSPIYLKHKLSCYLAYRINPQAMPCQSVILNKREYLKHLDAAISFIGSLGDVKYEAGSTAFQ